MPCGCRIAAIFPFSRWLAPRIGRGQLARAGRIALIGALAAGLFGMVHDQITYSISPEYFTKMKFGQFAGTDLGLPPRLRVALIGFLGSWWVGLIGGWFLARVAQAKFRSPGRRVTHAAAAILGISTVCALAGGWLGPGWLEDRAGWSEAMQAMGVTDAAAFRQVAGVHLGTYLGALAGWFGMMMSLWKVADDHDTRRRKAGTEASQVQATKHRIRKPK